MDNVQMHKGDRVAVRRGPSTFDRQLRSMLATTIQTMIANGDREGVRIVLEKFLRATT